MTGNGKKILGIMPKLNSQRVDMLLEEVIGCRWTISVLGAVAKGVRRPGALERHIEGISTKVLSDRLRHFTRADLEHAQAAGQKLDIRVLGLATIADDVSPDLARAAIGSIQVLGALHASAVVKSALADRIR